MDTISGGKPQQPTTDLVDRLREAFDDTFITATSGGDEKPFIKIRFADLGQMQRAHSALCDVLTERPAPLSTEDLPHPKGDVGPYRFLDVGNGDGPRPWCVGSRSYRTGVRLPPTDGLPYWIFDVATGEPRLIGNAK